MRKDPELKSVEIRITDTPIPKAKMDALCKLVLEMYAEYIKDEEMEAAG